MYIIQKECDFAEIFTKRPSPQARCRSDFDGTQWWTTWSRPEENTENAGQTALFENEMNGFREFLMAKPQMQTLETMKEYCQNEAQPTSDPTEFNLYSQTEHYNVWIRLITRSKDYNLYIHFYLKESKIPVTPPGWEQ